MRVIEHGVVALACLMPGALAAQRVDVSIQPREPYEGSIFRVEVIPVDERPEIADVRGRLFGEELHFERRGGVWTAIAGVPVDAEGDTDWVLVTVDPLGETHRHNVGVVIRPTRFGADTLTVSSRFTSPLDAATRDRIGRERRRAARLPRVAHSMPRLWREPFIMPTGGPTTSSFGRARVFNGRVTSRHLGLDLDGETGDPVRAANDGVVALVGDFFYSGNVVYLHHGAGLMTVYMHMSQVNVAEGDRVRRGDVIGLVGETGRVTGPHLHWTARYGSFSVNPLSLLSDLGYERPEVEASP